MADVTLTEGEAVVVEHETQNYGDIVDTQTITLEVDGTQEDAVSGIELAPDESYRGQLVWETEAGDAQGSDYDLCVVTADGNEDCITVNVS